MFARKNVIDVTSKERNVASRFHIRFNCGCRTFGSRAFEAASSRESAPRLWLTSMKIGTMQTEDSRCLSGLPSKGLL